LDLSRQRLYVHVLDEDGRTLGRTAVRLDADALRTLVASIGGGGQEVSPVIESMTGARFVHDTLERLGWGRRDRRRHQGQGLGAAGGQKLTRSMPGSLAELARRDLVPEIWLPDPRSAPNGNGHVSGCTLYATARPLQNRIHATLMTFGHLVSVTDLFGIAGREILCRLALPEPWTTTLTTSLRMVDELNLRIDACAEDPAHPRGRSPGQAAAQQPRCPWAAGQERAQVPALGAHRSGHPCRPRSALPGSL
jgi:transposase